MKRLNDIWLKHGRLILITFEVFWIVVFILDRVSKGDGSSIPQFAYVNF